MNEESQSGVRNSECGMRWPGKGGLLVFIVTIALAAPAGADYVGLEVVIGSDPICEDQSQPEIPFDLEVCTVFAVFSNPADRLMGIGDVNISTTDSAGFFQHPQGGNTSPNCGLPPLFPDIVCDSYVTMSVDCNDGGDDSTTDPDFDSTLFNTAGGVAGGWYNDSPGNGQGVPDAEGRILIAQLSYKEVKTASGTVDIHAKIGGVNPVIKFDLESFDCAVPGGPNPCVRFYVDADNVPPDPNNNCCTSAGGCTGWADACPDLQDVLNLAGDGDQIWVAAGTYAPAGMAGPRRATLQLIDGVKIYGGFAGTEVLLGERDVALNETILSGDLNGDDLTTGNGENSFHVVTGSGNSATALLDGFTITAGNANGLVGDGFCFDVPGEECGEGDDCSMGLCVRVNSIGGGMIVVGGSPMVNNCTFSENRGFFAGGGMYIGSSSPTISNSTFSSNQTANSAGAMCNNFESTTKVRNCTFSGNTVVVAGGAMGNINGSSPTITNTTFSGNQAISTMVGFGGGVYNNDSTPTLINCTFSGNSSGMNGGGLSNNDFSDPDVINCKFIGNTAEKEGGGMHNTDSSNPTVTNCIFIGNRAIDLLSIDGDGGAIANVFSSGITLSNCTFSGNSASRSGGGLRVVSASATVNNCTFWENSDGGGTDESAQISGLAVVTFSDIMGLTEPGPFCDLCDTPPVCCNDGTPNGNIGDNPTVLRLPDPGGDGDWGTADDDFGNLRLKAASPCIDRADNTKVPFDTVDLDGDEDTGERTPIDLDAKPRFLDDPDSADLGVEDPGPPEITEMVDMGAYEFNPCGVCPSDTDDSGEIRVPDLIVLLGCWGSLTGDPVCACLDIDDSGSIRVPDLIGLLGDWGVCCGDGLCVGTEDNDNCSDDCLP